MADELDRIISNTASEVVERNLKIYGHDVVSSKYVNPIDGLKPIHRRIIWCAGTTTSKDSFMSLLGDITKYHVGGDSSIYAATIRLSQPFSIGHPLVTVHGNYGDQYDPGSAGHPRYLEVESSEFARDLFYNGVYSKAIPMMANKDFRLSEPVYFIPRLPTALYLNNLTIGYGFKSETPQLHFGNMCDLVMAFAEARRTTLNPYPPYKKTAHLMLPDFPINGYLRNKDELYRAYLQGKFETPIRLDGVVELASNNIRIRNFPYGTVPRGVLESIVSELQTNKNNWMHEILRDIKNYGSDDNGCDIYLEFKNNTHMFSILDKLKKSLSLSNTFHPKYIYVLDGKMHHYTPYEIVDIWYKHRVKSILAGIKGRQFDLAIELQKLHAYLTVVDHTDKVIKIIRGSDNDDIAVLRLSDSFKQLTRMQARMLVNSKISILTKNSKTELISDIEKTNTDLEALQGQYSKVDETIYNDAQFLKKKYNVPRNTKFTTDFIGYVHIDKEGIIQFNSESDLINILQLYRQYKHIDIQYYSNTFPVVLPILNNKPLAIDKGLPREYACDTLLKAPRGNVYTIVWMDGGVSIMDGWKIVKNEDVRYQLMNKEFWAIRRNGTVVESNVNQYSRRKTVSRGSSNDLLYTLPKSAKNQVVIHMNKHHPNEIRFDLILEENRIGRVSTLLDGDTVILTTTSIDKDVLYLGLDSECLHLCTTRIVRIENIKGLFTNRNSYILELNKVKHSELKKNVKKHTEIPHTLNIVFDIPASETKATSAKKKKDKS